MRSNRDVRFTPESGHRPSALGCPLRAKRRHADYFDSTLTSCSTMTGKRRNSRQSNTGFIALEMAV